MTDWPLADRVESYGVIVYEVETNGYAEYFLARNDTERNNVSP